jgi:3-phenylpropionate/trans-cinnamate dioxygenase alpha subunit
LIEVPRVESFRGLVFANAQPDGAPLTDYLGEMTWYLDLFLNRSASGTELLPGLHRWKLRSNWKLPADQFMGDMLHAPMVHQSLSKLGLDQGFGQEDRDFVARFDEGHAWLNLSPRIPAMEDEFEARVRAEAANRLSEEQVSLFGCLYVATIFPNFSIVANPGFVSLRVWQPRGPLAMEIWSWSLVEKESPPSVRKQARDLQARLFSPSGMAEGDDVVIWQQTSQALRGPLRRRYPLNCQSGRERGGAHPARPGVVSTLPSEDGVFAYYLQWRALMSMPEASADQCSRL